MSTELLKERFGEIERLAHAAGLRPYDVHFFEVPAPVIWQTASYGLPTRYSHWSFGRVYQHQKTQGEMGFARIYELILNSDPSLAFLDKRNTSTTNLFIAAHCYAPCTYVQTSSGIKMIEDVQPGEKVRNHKGKWTKVNYRTADVFSGEMVEIQAGGYKFSQTDDHQLKVIRTLPEHRRKWRSWKAAFENISYSPVWIDAGEIKPGDFLVVNKPQDIGRGTLDSVVIPIDKTLHRRKVEEQITLLMNQSFGQFVGLYLAEGYARPKGQMGLCYNAGEGDLHKLSVSLIKSCFGLDSFVETKGMSTQVQFNEVCIAAFLRDKLGHSCYSKQLPDEWLSDAPREFLRGVLQGFLWGDGTKCWDRSSGFTTTSPVLARQIQEIAMLSGVFFGVSPRDESTPEQPRAISFVGIASGEHHWKVLNILGYECDIPDRSWSGVIDQGDYFAVKVQSVESEDYEGVVYCLNVEDGASFTLANGVVTHNCYAHSDFFANNCLFVQTGETQMIDVAKRHAVIIEKFREEYGEDVVDEWLDIALAMEQHIDVYKGYRRKRYPVRTTNYKEREIKPYEDIVNIKNKEPVIQKVLEGIHIPPHPERDILWFLSEYASLEPWQQKIFEIVRRESYYFYPQFRTKIMNEGWASYWHKELMDQYALGNDNDYGVTDIKYPLSNEEHLDFLTHHEKVVQPGVKERLKEEQEETDPMGRPTGRKVKVWSRLLRANPKAFGAITRLNPYYVGFRMFRDIKERWDEYYEQGYREDEWGQKIPVTVNGSQKIREVMIEEDDISFMRNYLTEELAYELHLFTYGNTDKYKDDFGVQEKIKQRFGESKDDLGKHPVDEQYIENKTVQVQSKELKDILHGFARSRNNYGVPEVVIRRVDEAGLLRLEHVRTDGINLDLAYAEQVLKYIYQAWRRPVELIRKPPERACEDDNKTWVLSYNGHQFEVDYMGPEYPEEIEENDIPSSW